MKMKKKMICICFSILIIVLLGAFIIINKKEREHRNIETSNESFVVEKEEFADKNEIDVCSESDVDTKNSNVVKDNYKDNPIDKYIDKKLENDNLTYAEIRNIKRLYGILWKEEYGNVLDFLKKKYGNKSKIKDLDKEIETYVEKMTKITEIIYYDTDEATQEKNLGLSYGTDMQFAEGQIYRDVCMFLITNSAEDYTFLKKNYKKIVIP